MLVNFRIDAEVARKQFPEPFRPKLHDGWAAGGICLIRLEDIRPKRFPRILGISSENAAHRFAVTWTDEAGDHEGVYIPRRDSGSLLNQLAGGRIFPGEHHRAAFNVTERGDDIELSMISDDGAVSVHVAASVAGELSPGSIFGSLAEASAFFEGGSLGYSATSGGHKLDGIRLRTDTWRVEPLAVRAVQSSYFGNTAFFPPGSIAFDCALLMRNIAHEWEWAAEMYV